jgi:hypothetical protein
MIARLRFLTLLCLNASNPASPPGSNDRADRSGLRQAGPENGRRLQSQFSDWTGYSPANKPTSGRANIIGLKKALSGNWQLSIECRNLSVEIRSH